MNYTVLIVDDETMPRMVLRQNLPWSELHITQVCEASDGEEAIEAALACRPDIIISDVKMPRKNGLEMAQEVRNFLPLCQFIFLSGYSDKAYLKGAIRLKAANYVEKPIDLDELSGALREVVGELDKAASPDPADVFFHGKDAHGAPRNAQVYSCSETQLSLLEEHIHKNRAAEANELLHRIYLEMGRCEATEPEYIRQLYCSITFLFLCAAQSHNLTRITSQADHLLYTAARQDTLAELWDSLSQLSTSYFSEMNPEKGDVSCRVEQFLARHYQDCELTVQDVAGSLNFANTYLCAAYKKSCGKTINRRLTEIRLQHAKELLTQTDGKLYEIARAVGYADGKYFVKLFTKEIGLSPREYRGRNRHES